MNLATAYSSGRAREMGIRKVLGSQKKMLVIQFLVESIGYSFLALLVAMFIVEVMLPLFNNLAGKSLQFDIFNAPLLLLLLFLLTLAVGLIAGIYPGFYLSSFKPAQVLKGNSGTGTNNIKLRNVLVILQFTVTIGLIACTLLVQDQMDFLRNSNLGFNKEGLVVISNENHRLGGHAEAFKEALKNNSNIINASLSTGVPPYYGFEDSYKAKDKEGEQIDLQLNSYMVDEDFISTLGIKVIEGRSFSKDFSTDSASVLLNESAVKLLGWKNPIGKILTYPGGNYKNYKVIGVIKDFNFLTLHEPITPFALFNTKSKSYDIPGSYIVVRIPRTDPERNIKFLESEWKTFAPNIPFEYKFLEEGFEEQYNADDRLGKIFIVFSFLTIFIACIGLFGLVSFSSKQRTKEIGIRKVLGASVSSIVGLLVRNFVTLVLAANIIACPVAYYFMNKWLENFAYRINLNAGPFLIASFTSLLIAITTIIFQAIKAATTNPVKSLRYE
jgi:putative ABC transport system permease protein